MPIGCLSVQGYRVIDGGWNPCSGHGSLQGVPVADWQAQRILCPDRSAALQDLWHDGKVAKLLVIALANTVAGHNLARENLELLEQNGGLHGVQPAVHPDPDIVVLVRALCHESGGSG